jgi:hypothetical protein
MSAPPDLTTPQWRRVIKRIRALEGPGCVQAATELFENADDLGLVDAVIVGATVRRGGQHWWVEAGPPGARLAFDFSANRSSVMLAAEYRAGQGVVEYA